jgi:hypothetical protein
MEKSDKDSVKLVAATKEPLVSPEWVARNERLLSISGNCFAILAPKETSRLPLLSKSVLISNFKPSDLISLNFVQILRYLITFQRNVSRCPKIGNIKVGARTNYWCGNYIKNPIWRPEIVPYSKQFIKHEALIRYNNTVARVHERTIPNERPKLVGKLVLSFVGKRCCVVSADLYSQGWVYLVPDPLLLRKSGSAGNGTRTSGTVARNSYHWTTKAVSR